MAEITYSKPTWADNTTPAMSAANVQAISDALDLAVHSANRASAGKTLDADTVGGVNFASTHSSNLKFASGYGIDFSATSDAGGMTSEVLDDYEEGTWTITLTPSTSGTITPNTSYDTGSYTKIGNRVFVSGGVTISSVGSPVGVVIRLSLPFAIGTGTKYSARIGGAVQYYDATVADTFKPYNGAGGNAFISIIMDASTVAANDQFLIDLSYLV